MEITYEKVRSTKTRIRLLFLAVLLGAGLGGAGGLHWQAGRLGGAENRPHAQALLIRYAGYKAGDQIYLWHIIGGGQKTTEVMMVAWAVTVESHLGPHGIAQIHSAYKAIAASAAAGALGLAMLLMALARQKPKSNIESQEVK